MRSISRFLTPVLAAAFVLGAAACSDDNGGTVDAGSDGGGPTLVAPVPGSDDPVLVDPIPVDPGIGGAIPITPTPGLDNPTPTAIDSIVLADPKTLDVSYYSGVAPCYGLDSVNVQETAETVTIEVVTGTPPEAAGQACIELAQIYTTQVALSQALGSRVVIDASSGTPVTVIQ